MILNASTMSWFGVFIVLIFSILINIIISSFLIMRSHHSKKVISDVEQTVSNLIKNVNQATYEQITLAEDTIKKLRFENKCGKEIHDTLAFLDDKKYQTLLNVLKVISKKKKKSEKKQISNHGLQEIDYDALSRDEIDLLKL